MMISEFAIVRWGVAGVLSLTACAMLMLPASRGIAQTTELQERGVAMTPKCSVDELLPGVAAMTAKYPQRIPLPDGNVDEQGIYGKLTNGQRIIGHLPSEIQDGIRAQSGSLMRNGALPPALREMIIVRVGYHATSIYEVEQHRSVGEKVGVSTEKLDQLACRKPSGLTAEESSAIDLVDALLTTNRVSDDTLSRARSHHSDSEIIEMIFVVGNWWTLARVLETAGIPLDDGRIGDRPLERISQ